MLTILMAALAMQSQPTAKEAMCSLNDLQAVPCVVAYKTDVINNVNVSAMGFMFDENTSVIYVGEPTDQGINVKFVVLNDKPFEVEGVCMAKQGVVGCVATRDNLPVKVIAAF